MSTKPNRFVDFEWMIFQKRRVYLITGLIVLGVIAIGAGVYIRVYGNPFANTQQVVAAPAGARFDSFEGDVRVVRAQTRENTAARSDTQLYAGDTVQTGTDGRARISFIDGSTYVVRPNSVITVRNNAAAEGGGRTNVRVAVARGQINVRTEQSSNDTTNVVETRLTESRLSGQTASSFGVGEDNTEDIRVSVGQIETSTRGGEKTTVASGEYISINQSGNIKSREKLLEVPLPAAPRNLEKIPAGAGGATNIALRWQRPASGTTAHYRVEVATSPFFVAAGKVIERDQLAATVFNAGDVRPGNYFWRVRAVAASGQISEWSEPQKFVVVALGSGEQLTITEVTFEYVGGNIYIVRGVSQPGTTVSIAGRETLSDSNGAFQLQITAPKGTRELTAEAADAQGNRDSHRIPFTPDTAQR